MSFQKIFIRSSASIFVAAFVFGISAFGQNISSPGFSGIAEKPMAVAGSTNLYCAGFVQTAPIGTGDKIVGAVEEQEQLTYHQNDNVYINMGSNKGVRVGDIFSVVRPRGEVSTSWTKKGELGFYVQEVGALEVVNVKSEVSVARVKTSCDSLMMGDLVQATEHRVSPQYVHRSMDRFANPSGKATGRIFMAQGGHEMVTRDQIVYIDLGRDDNVKVGDYLTVYRPLGKGHLFAADVYGAGSARDKGFESDKFRGGQFSNQAPRKSGDKADGKVVTIEKAKADRPAGLRKIVGEVMILNVKERTATAVITKTGQEIVTGDWVEVQ